MFSQFRPITWSFLSLTIANAWITVIVVAVVHTMGVLWRETVGEEGMPAATNFALDWAVLIILLSTLVSAGGMWASARNAVQPAFLTLGFNLLVVIELFGLALLLATMFMPALVMTHRLGS